MRISLWIVLVGVALMINAIILTPVYNSEGVFMLSLSLMVGGAAVEYFERWNDHKKDDKIEPKRQEEIST